jgi:uncharacterized membrane protein
MVPIEHIHPMIVHFPIALIIASVVLGILSRITKIERFSYSAHYVMIFGVISGYIAIIFGYFAFKKIGAVYEVVENIALIHSVLGVIVIALFTVLLIMKGEINWLQLGKENIPEIVSCIVGIVLLLWIAALGGKMVYEYGVAVNKEIIKEEYLRQ